jgi:glycosyltransferase involved in cell wall biosynthesis
MRLLRKSSAVVITSCLQIFPALISKLLGAKIVLDINDVNSRTSLRIQDTATRIIRYFFWRPLESFGCMLANIVLINKEAEEEFLITRLHVHQSKILVIKTCLEENQGESDKSLKSELENFKFGDKRIILFLANMEAFMNQGAANYILKELAPSFAESTEFKDIMFVLAGIGSDGLQPLTSNVITTGTLSETSVHALMNRADICIDPALISGGVKTKIQYYLKMGKVIVTTPAGAEGINLNGRKDLAFLNSRVEHFENTLKYALMNLERLKKLAVNNCDVYERQFSWETFLKQVAMLIQKISETS